MAGITRALPWRGHRLSGVPCHGAAPPLSPRLLCGAPRHRRLKQVRLIPVCNEQARERAESTPVATGDPQEGRFHVKSPLAWPRGAILTAKKPGMRRGARSRRPPTDPGQTGWTTAVSEEGLANLCAQARPSPGKSGSPNPGPRVLGRSAPVLAGSRESDMCGCSPKQCSHEQRHPGRVVQGWTSGAGHAATTGTQPRGPAHSIPRAAGRRSARIRLFHVKS